MSETFLAFSCLHYQETPPINRKDDYGEMILGKLNWILETARRMNAIPLCLGDWTEKKTGITEREKILLMRVLLNHIDEGGHRVRTILGNHDIQAYHPDVTTQAIGVLEIGGAIEIVQQEEFDTAILTGENYHADYEQPETYNRQVDSEKFHIHMTHGMLTDKRLPWEAIDKNAIESHADILINGHNHGYWEDEEKGIYNVGAVARIAKTDNNMTKQPMVLVIQASKFEPKIWKLEIPIEQDVWIHRLTRETMSSEEVEEFVAGIKEAGELKDDSTILKTLLKEKSERAKELVYESIGE